MPFLDYNEPNYRYVRRRLVNIDIVDEVLAETKDLIDALAEPKKNLYDFISVKANYYSLSGESVEVITQIVIFDCESAFLTLKQEIFDFYSKRYVDELVMHMVDAELESIKEEMKLNCMKIVLNNKVQEKIKKIEEKAQFYKGLLPKYS